MNLFKNSYPEFYREPSFLNVNSITQWKKEKGAYNFEHLPPTAVLVINNNIIKALSKPFRKKLKGFPGTGFLLNPSLLICAMHGSGAPGLLVLMEELRVLGVENFLFIGTAGMICEGIAEGQAYVASKAYSTVGSTFFYSKETVLQPENKSWYGSIKEHLNVPECTSWSTDCPYRETPSLIAEYKSQNAQLVDMESAAVYAFCEFYRLNSVCILIAADSLTQSSWQAPKRPDLLFQRQKEIIIQMTTYSFPD